MTARKFKEAQWYDTFGDMTAENRALALFVLDVLHRQCLRKEQAERAAQAGANIAVIATEEKEAKTNEPDCPF